MLTWSFLSGGSHLKEFLIGLVPFLWVSSGLWLMRFKNTQVEYFQIKYTYTKGREKIFQNYQSPKNLLHGVWFIKEHSSIKGQILCYDEENRNERRK